MKRLYFDIDKENDKVILDRKDFNYLMSKAHIVEEGISYIKRHLVLGSYSPLFDEKFYQLDDEFSYEDLLYILNGVTNDKQ